ncbi:alpha-L-fucosidase [Aliifodinibius sp. S!AR15-10]|nr:alpha-L-fucosidase [Aliifodinibius sp. S!AR15-10]
MHKVILLVVILISFLSTELAAQLSGGGEAHPNLQTNLESLEDWQDMRFGMFIHWGPVTLRGTEIGWSRGEQVPIEDYDQLYQEFNPVLFDAKQWVRTAKQAGMKYLIITSKHHDGFALWDSKRSDYDMMSTPYGKDVLEALSEECEKQGIEFGIYYSIADWHHPDYPVNQRSLKPAYQSASEAKKKEAMADYIPYMKGQLKEIIENYDPAVLWFDGEWESPWTHQMGMELYAYVKGLNPDILINNRVDKGRQGMAGMTISEKYAGDFGTPEQEVGNYNTETPWESCITIGRQWAWRPNDKLKSTKQLLHLLLNTVGGDGNLLLNVGPMMDGRIEQRQIRRLHQVGDWLRRHGESVYRIRGGPYRPTETMVSTRKGNKIYLHLLAHPGSELTLPLPEGVQVNNARLLRTDQKLNLRQAHGNLKISLPSRLPNDVASVVALELNRPAQELGTIER